MFERKKATVPYTTLMCDRCGAIQRRRFEAGDVLFSEGHKCACGGTMTVEKIYGEEAS